MLSWLQPPGELPSLETSVQVWAVRLDDPGIDVERGHDLLSLAERERAARFKFAKHRRRYVAAHAALHEILGRYLRAQPRRLSFEVGANGKPKLTGETGIDFNLSHSEEMALIAVGRGRELGVDIEQVREKFEFEEVAERFFSAKEVAALRALPPALQRRAFYKCWTSKEAFLKAKGTGLSGALDEVDILLTDHRHVRIAAAVPGWRLCELASIVEYESALVCAGAPTGIHCYQWQPG